MEGILLKSQLYGEAAYLCAELTNEEPKADDGMQKDVDGVYQRNFLSVVSEPYYGFHKLLNTRRCDTESLKSFEVCISAAVAKFNSVVATTKFPQ